MINKITKLYERAKGTLRKASLMAALPTFIFIYNPSYTNNSAPQTTASQFPEEEIKMMELDLRRSRVENLENLCEKEEVVINNGVLGDGRIIMKRIVLDGNDTIYTIDGHKIDTAYDAPSQLISKLEDLDNALNSPE
ncbi:MAG: hypothetical protein AABX59_03770, partial [Nanoarchaeota archaeon]